MKITALSLLIAIALPSAVFAKPVDSFDSIVTSAAYKKVASEQKKLGYGFGCEGIMEKLESQDYSSLGGETSVFKLVILQCSVDPRDSGDAIRQAGLAVISHGEVVSFSLGRIAQPD